VSPATTFPAPSLEAALPDLRRPFSPAAVKWKVQTQTPKESPKNGLIVGYVDARLVAERLNLVCGGEWSDAYALYGDRLDAGFIICHLTIDGVTRSDVGQGSGKAGYSDALKRAAVKFGVGVSLYAMKQIWLTTGGSNGRPALERDGKYLRIPNDADAWLRGAYAKWIEKGAGKVFGKPLSHGDEEGSVGALMDEPVQASGPDDTELAALREEAEALYAQLDPASRPNLKPGKFKAQLKAADTRAKLEKIVAEVKAL
jgi:hypothetical protein